MNTDNLFRKELEDLINKHSMETWSDTPDWILAEYLHNCLENFDKTLQRRENYYGRIVSNLHECGEFPLPNL